MTVCLNCPRRELGCHSKCPEYLAARAENIAKSEAKRTQDGLLSYRNMTYWRVRNNLAKTKGAVKTFK